MLSCSKEKRIENRNELPFTIHAMSGVSSESQTKEISFNKKNGIDVVFKCSGTTRFTTSYTSLWVEIINPDIEIIASTQIDSLYRDSLSWGDPTKTELHNRTNGMNFYKLDTILIATGFDDSSIDTKPFSSVADREVMIHIQNKERFSGGNFPMDIEQGALKRINDGFIGFRCVKTGRVFMVEIEKSYTLKSISLIKE